MIYQMSWKYIAGFFDGEGTIYFKEANNKGNKTFVCNCVIPQAEFQGQVIYEIQEFLKKEKINTRLYRSKNKGENKNYILRLNITAYGEMKRFLKKVSPYLIVKKQKSIEAIKFCEEKLKNNANLTIVEKGKIVSLNSKGMYIEDIGKILKRHPETIRVFLTKNSIPRNYKNNMKRVKLPVIKK